MCTRPMTKFVDLKIISVKSRLLLLFRAAFQRVAVTVFRWRKRMRTCPHMSPGCSSPWDLNIAPARHYCCHSQTHSDLLTPPAQKRLDADTFTANVFHQCKKRERKRDSEWEMSASVQREDNFFFSVSVLLFPLSPNTVWFLPRLIEGRQMIGPRIDQTVGRFSTPDAQPEVRGQSLTATYLCYRWAWETLVLQAAARPRVGSVLLHTAHFLFLSNSTARV